MRLFTDWKLIWEASPFWIVLLAVIGFLIGVILAHHYWYRSARRLRLAREENDPLTRESREWGNDVVSKFRHQLSPQLILNRRILW